MKKILLSLMLAFTVAGCTSETEYGDCVGLFEDRDPTLVYETDTGNVILAVIFSETLIVPAIVLIDETYCPVKQRKVAK